MRTRKSVNEPTKEEIETALPGNMNFENDLSIDALALDVEWLEQPQLFFRYSEALAKARRDKDESKRALLIARTRVRKELIDSGQKTTEAIIEEAAAETAEMEEYINTSYIEDLLDAAVKAMHQRKTTLENMVELLKMQYFSSPKEPRDLSNMIGKKHNVRSQIGDALNKK